MSGYLRWGEAKDQSQRSICGATETSLRSLQRLPRCLESSTTTNCKLNLRHPVPAVVTAVLLQHCIANCDLGCFHYDFVEAYQTSQLRDGGIVQLIDSILPSHSA